MKFLFKILTLMGCLVPFLRAAETERYGFLNVVNLIPSSSSCEINLAGKVLVPDGLKAGVETGWFMVPIGSHAVSIQHSEYKKFSSTISVVEKSSHLIVIYLQAKERLQPDRKPSPPLIRFASFPAYESKGFTLRAVSMLPERNRFQLARETIELEFLKVTEIPKWTGGGFHIQHNGKPIGEVIRGSERASYMLLLGADFRGNYLTTLVNADIQSLPPWMKKDIE